ncbi:MAG TPA: folylpolyglutamate synthase/dihydrofolate synthase family protein [Actinomycetota bacterium]|nr:folylpolyglutamate synthase/dihydrofolate synthase family protein [Actinomycetota bacterium]
MRFDEAVARLDRRQPEHMPEPSLDRIRAVTALLDDPQLTYPTLHVTGTNGKTTIARAAADIACAHGVKAGLFTSPHLHTVRERLSVCGVEISEDDFAEEWMHLEPFLEVVDRQEHGATTYFEAVTALAFLWFADKPVGLAVVEVGMGGSWDATNLVAGEVAVIGEIGLDHPELGSSVQEVATEKAGIIKPGKTVVVREQPHEALKVIEARASEVGATLLLEERDWEVEARVPAVGGQHFRVRGIHTTYDDLFLPMFGEHAVRNVAAATVAVESVLGKGLDPDLTRSSIDALRIPGRLEVITRSPLIVLDGAHNPGGAEALARTLAEAFTWSRMHLVLAVSSNKDLDGVIAALAPLADVWYPAQNESVRSFPAKHVAERIAAAGGLVADLGTVEESLAAARDATATGDLILVTGSLYTVADARRALGGS